MQMGVDDDVHIAALVADGSQQALNVLPLVLPGAGMMVGVGALRPGHAGVDEKELVAALDQIGVDGQRDLLVGHALEVGSAGMMVVVLEGVGRHKAGVQGADGEIGHS